MAQKKLIRFKKLTELPNVLEKPEGMQGQWSAYFKNKNPIVLELACGRGEYAVGLGQMHPQQNFIGVDIKGDRMFLGARKALAENLDNVAFLRTEIEKLPEYFEPGEVSAIWITFPDPHLRTSKAKKRLTHPRFLRLYKKVLATDAPVFLKTDSPALYQFTKLVLDRYNVPLLDGSEDVYADKTEPEFKIETHYERLDIAESSKIFYLKFTVPEIMLPPDDALQKYLQATEPKFEG